MSGWKQEQVLDRGLFEVVIDVNKFTDERRIAVYKGETLMALEFVKPLNDTIERLMAMAFQRSKQFPTSR